jgi:hypothetical protein
LTTGSDLTKGIDELWLVPHCHLTSIVDTVLHMPRPGLLLLAAAVLVLPAAAQSPKTFIDYFLPTPIVSPLSTTAWGAATVGRPKERP